MVVLESLSQGLPVICLDLGGPQMVVNSSCGRVISTRNKTEKEVSADIANCIFELGSNVEEYLHCSRNAINHSKTFTWKKTVTRGFALIMQHLK